MGAVEGLELKVPRAVADLLVEQDGDRADAVRVEEVEGLVEVGELRVAEADKPASWIPVHQLVDCNENPNDLAELVLLDEGQVRRKGGAHLRPPA